jgi:hypothetical protein
LYSKPPPKPLFSSFSSRATSPPTPDTETLKESIGVSGKRQSASELARAAEAEDFRLYQALRVSAERVRQSVREAVPSLDVSLGQTVGQHPPQRQVQQQKVATPQKEVQQEKIHERTHDHSLGIGF